MDKQRIPSEMIRELSKKTNMSDKQVKCWIFNSRKQRVRREINNIEFRKILKDFYVLNKYPKKK